MLSFRSVSSMLVEFSHALRPSSSLISFERLQSVRSPGPIEEHSPRVCNPEQNGIDRSRAARTHPQ